MGPLQIFVLSLLIAILAYRKNTQWHWVSVGLLVDFCLRFYVSHPPQAGPVAREHAWLAQVQLVVHRCC